MGINLIFISSNCLFNFFIFSLSKRPFVARGFSPNFSSHKEALDYIIIAIENAGYMPGKNVSIALDVASTEFYSNNEYNLKGENKKLDSQGLIDFLDSLTSEYPIISIEDGLAEDDWEGWKSMTDQIGNNVQLSEILFKHRVSLRKRNTRRKSERTRQKQSKHIPQGGGAPLGAPPKAAPVFALFVFYYMLGQLY